MRKYSTSNIQKVQLPSANIPWGTPVPWITLWPGEIISEQQRYQIVRRPFVKFRIPADADGGHLPASFHEPSLQWVIEQANVVIVNWLDVDAPQGTTELTAASVIIAIAPYVYRGGCITLIKADKAHLIDWYLYARRHASHGTPIHFAPAKPVGGA